VLEVQQLRFAYRRGGAELFSALDYRFEPGAVTGVTGPSGRGKSTLLYLLGLLLRPTGGRVLFDGRPVQSLSEATRSLLRAKRIGFVFQDAALDESRSVLDAVMEPAIYAGTARAAAIDKARTLLIAFDVQARSDHRPGEISGGQAQRVALCRALMNDPTLILADEPTGNLDRDSASIVLGALHRAARSGRTVVIATHDPFVLEQVDHILVLG
jgi:ABC-type lipoprotein export system ATPase subunit